MMVEGHDFEWLVAQKVILSVDLVAAAKQQLRFLAAVDRNRNLYEGPLLRKAIHRYAACWLPLLAKHCERPVSEGPLVVPLDCEWVWHCHRLNPVQYKLDCEKLYGRILDNLNVVSSVNEVPIGESEAIWRSLYPEEHFKFELIKVSDDQLQSSSYNIDEILKYDLLEAARRQAPFFYQVSRPQMNDEQYLDGAVERYKGFLHLIKTNRAKGLKIFCIPTYDIDLIWHSHQLHPTSYCEDMTKILGNILEHDDTDPDRTKGNKLDIGFSKTTRQWEEIFGFRYMRAGAMYRGHAPMSLKSSNFEHVFGANPASSVTSENVFQVPEVYFEGEGYVIEQENVAVSAGCGGGGCSGMCGNFLKAGGCGAGCGGGCGGRVAVEGT